MNLPFYVLLCPRFSLFIFFKPLTTVDSLNFILLCVYFLELLNFVDSQKFIFHFHFTSNQIFHIFYKALNLISLLTVKKESGKEKLNESTHIQFKTVTWDLKKIIIMNKNIYIYLPLNRKVSASECAFLKVKLVFSIAASIAPCSIYSVCVLPPIVDNEPA